MNIRKKQELLKLVKQYKVSNGRRLNQSMMSTIAVDVYISRNFNTKPQNVMHSIETLIDVKLPGIKYNIKFYKKPTTPSFVQLQITTDSKDYKVVFQLLYKKVKEILNNMCISSYVY